MIFPLLSLSKYNELASLSYLLWLSSLRSCETAYTLQFMIEKACTQAQPRNATKTAKWGKCSGALKFWVVDTWINYINNLNTSSFFIMNTVSGNMFLTILTYLYMLL